MATVATKSVQRTQAGDGVTFSVRESEVEVKARQDQRRERVAAEAEAESLSLNPAHSPQC